MKIRAQLFVGLAVFALLLLLVSALVVTTNREVERLDRQGAIAQGIALKAGELGYLSDDYILYREQQQVDRWESKYASIAEDVAALSPNTPEQLAISGSLKANLQNLRSVFDGVTSAPPGPGGTDTALIQLSWSRLAIQNQGMVFDASRLANLLRNESNRVKMENFLLTLALMGLFSGYLLTSYFVFYRRTLRSLAGLQEGTRAIGSGNLDFTIAERGDDEISELSRAFDRMSASLKTVTARKSDLEREIAERRQAEEALRASEGRLRILYESMSEGFANYEVVNVDGKAVDYILTGVNPAFERITGLTRAHAVGKKASELYGTGKPPHLDVYARVASGAGPEHFETYFPPMKQHFSVSAFSPGMGKFATVFTDITDRKEAEAALQGAKTGLEIKVRERTGELEHAKAAVDAERQRLYAVLETMPVYVVLLSEDYHVPFANRFFRERFGESHGRRCYEYLFNRAEPCETCETFQALKTWAPHHWEWLGPDRRNYDIYDYPFTDTDGSRLIMEVGIDVTEQKRARDQLEALVDERTKDLRESELRYRTVADNTHDWEFWLDPEGRFLYCSPSCERLIGHRAEEFMGDSGLHRRIIHPEDVEVFNRHIRREKAQESGGGEWRFLRPDGTWCWVEHVCQPVYGTGREFLGTRGSNRDITERKKSEEVLRETSQYLENLINYANAPIIVWDPQFRITRFNHAFERLTGRSAEEVMGKGLEILFPKETADVSMDHIRRAMTGERWEVVEIPILHRDGSVRTVLWNSATLYEADGKTVLSAIAQGQDITDRKQTEDELHDTSQYLENLINYANAPIIVWDPDFHLTRFNQAFERLTGRAAADVLGRPVEILFPPEYVEASMDLIRKTMGGERWESVEIPILHRDGGVRTVLWNSAPLYEADGVTVSSAIAQGQDITDRKQMVEEIARNAGRLVEANAELSAEIAQRKKAEEEVRRTLSTLNAALESTAEAMLVIDRSGRITSYNQNFTTMWNIPESVLQTLDTRVAIEHLSVQMRDPDGFMDRMKEISDHPSRESFDMLEPLDGRVIERYSKPQKIGNSIVGRVYSFRDITERKRAELQLIQSLEEKEVLLREIHHRVKNNLQLTTSLLDMTRLRTPDPKTSGILTDVMLKVQTMAQIHTRLYESKQFDRINMDSQIRDQIRALTSIYSRGDREITTVIDSPDLFLPLDQAIPCALALNEILSNAFKHAFRGRTRGTVKYTAEEEDGRIRFTISDDGVGLPRGFDLSKANSLGLKLVRTLVEQQLKGTLRMKRGKGTEVLVEIPGKGEEGEHV